MLGLAACPGGNGATGFVPAASQTATRTPQDGVLPHI